MVKKSRKKTRQCLFQALYSCIYLQETFNKDSFIESFYDEQYKNSIDTEYFNEMFDGIIEKELELTYIVKKFAPKFDINSMPIINIIPIFISSYELLYLKCDKIPYKVSIDEALELTKRYSDDHGRMLVNGILNSLNTEKNNIISELEKIKKENRYFFKLNNE